MIHVIGHLHPDSDAVCTAYMTARWLTLRGHNAQAWCTGELNRETLFIFNAANLPCPEQLNKSLRNQNVWLVDFTEPAQGPDSLCESNIVGIIDHHRLGGLYTQLPPEVWIKPVGSSATLLWHLMSQEIRANLSPSEAILMLGAIISDTVALRSPTTTDDDRTALDELFPMADIMRDKFITDLLTAKTNIDGLNTHQLIHKDIKNFNIHGTNTYISQIELYSLNQIAPLIEELRREMGRFVAETKADLMVLMLTDISSECSTLYFAGSIFDSTKSYSIKEMLSRKKQLLPWLSAHLNQRRGKS